MFWCCQVEGGNDINSADAGLLLIEEAPEKYVAPPLSSSIENSPSLKPGYIRANIVKSGDQKLGMIVNYKSGCHLLVTSIREGVVEDWNNNNPSSAVEAGDLLLAINGKKGSCRELLTELLKSGTLDLLVQKAT
mmetsp:Transcript_34485/g.55066  ORF Transcript_34485/g.55066 Transcript_34485/m.55066 type:complete len:134 (+) Transcript_34485:60-461(+)